MPPFRKPTLVTLRRKGPNQPWGFRLAGGAEVQQPFRIQKVTEESLAFLGGLSENDEIVRIGNISLRGLTHEEAQQIILRCAYCIDLFVLRDNAESIEPRFTLALDTLVNRPPFSSRSQTPVMHLPPPGSAMGDYDPVKAQTISFKDTKTYITEEFKNMDPLQRAVATNNKNLFISQVSDPTVGRQEYSPRIVEAQPRFPTVRVAQSPSGAQIKDPRVFGLSRSKSPNDPNRDSSISPLPNPEMNQYGQEPKTPTALGMGFEFGQDMNNNVVDASQKVVYGLPNREVSVAVPPSMTNNYNQQTQQFQQQQTRTVYTINQRHRFNSLTGAEHDWKEPLPIVNIPNTDQLLPSQTRQMQTYINQAPPTEKNLRPSLSGLERRRIRPVWPPPSAGRFRPGYNVEGRDSPNSRMMAWPPRASSVDRDFGYGEQGRHQTPDRFDGNGNLAASGRVNSQTRLWPPPSNATPAGFPDIEVNDEEQYAYDPYATDRFAPGAVSTHIPQTYRPPPGTQHLQINEF